MILDNPEHELKRLCKHANIPFLNAMLSWPKGLELKMVYGRRIGIITYTNQMDS